MTRLRIVWVVMLAAGVLGAVGPAWAQDKDALNSQAYKGITFGEIFGEPGEAALAAEDACSASSEKGEPVSLGAFVGLVLANLGEYAPTSTADVALVKDVTDKLAALSDYLDKNNTPETECLKAWPLRWFFEDDLANKTLTSQALQDTVQVLFQEHLEPLEQAGLTLPWLLVARRATQIEFLELAYNTRFLQRLGKMTYEDFFTITLDNPLIDDELNELVQQAIQIGLFGALHFYKEEPLAVVNLDELASGAATREFVLLL